MPLEKKRSALLVMLFYQKGNNLSQNCQRRYSLEMITERNDVQVCFEKVMSKFEETGVLSGARKKTKTDFK